MGRGLREILNDSPWLKVLLPTLLLAIGLGGIGREVWSSTNSIVPGISKAFYTTQESATGRAALDALFVGPGDAYPPIDHDGQPAVQAVVYKCDRTGTRWVNHLIRFTPKYKQRVAALQAARASGQWVDPNREIAEAEAGMEAKAPGDGPWLGSTEPGFSEVTGIHLPPGVKIGEITLLEP